MPEQARRKDLLFSAINWSLLIFCALVWGCSYYFIKKALIGFQPGELALIRIVSAAAFLLPFVFAAFKKIPAGKYPYVIICAIAGNGLPIYLYPLAQTHISSSLTGIVNSLTPLCTYILGVIFFRLHGSGMKLAGVLLGLAGATSLVLFKPGQGFQSDGDGIYLAVALLAPVLYGINGNVLKKYLSDLPGLQLTAIMYMLLLVPSLPLLFFTGIPGKVAADEAAAGSLPYALILGIAGTAIAMSLFNILLQRTQIMFATSVSYMMPVVAVLIGVIDHEQVGWNEFLGLGLILSGVILINRRENPKPVS